MRSSDGLWPSGRVSIVATSPLIHLGAEDAFDSVRCINFVNKRVAESLVVRFPKTSSEGVVSKRTAVRRNRAVSPNIVQLTILARASREYGTRKLAMLSSGTVKMLIFRFCAPTTSRIRVYVCATRRT